MTQNNPITLRPFDTYAEPANIVHVNVLIRSIGNLWIHDIKRLNHILGTASESSEGGGGF